ncbi:GNAT family N-acetyltransferase [Halomarina rubra]|uniref:GNAT family N-acetyltransferase n=1 Tax=Halomarina rubra TaxID=2071873 RepID=A0ABD6AXZ8_9EURY|nr:GNAT family N-acetyltransferase [Halomarina rubra]
MSPRPAETADTDRIRTVAESAMTASYSLSPRELDAVVEDQFGPERLDTWLEDADSVLFVREDEGTVVAVVKGGRRDGYGNVDWLFVDPEHRGKGHATALLEAAIEELERDDTQVRALALASNQEGEAFFERFSFERVEEREVEYGGENLTEHVYSRDADRSDVVDGDDDTPGSEEAVEFPDDDVTNDDGTEVRVDRDERRSGTKAPFFATYVDDTGEQHGFFCSNCGGTETAMDGMERLACQDCGNEHRPDGSEQYDDGYL